MRKALLLLIMLTCAAESKSIDWIITDFPPYYMISDANEGTGRDELIIDLLHQYLPAYSDNKVYFPASRAIRALSDKRHTFCMLSLHKTPQRQKFIQFSNHYTTVGLSPTIVMAKKTLEALGYKDLEQIKLKKFIEQHKLVLGVMMQRSYGKQLDAIINSMPKGQVVVRPGQDALESLTHMLSKGRVDAVIGYPSEHFYLHQLTGQKEMVQLLIEDVQPIAYGYVGCTNNESGKQIINEIDRILNDVAKSQAFKEIMLKWLPSYLNIKLSTLMKNPKAE
ncbi:MULTISPECIES: TIGR02285 family protein [Pseudoalteromonas]|uniref:TIGR02285 family protein n=1 Tax=Pseudoalteromonas obscura TaxID=3048491 RepID=A0ABT7EG97_9GAMM|nr:TIGR02285 family protein [Pseudoalteromonas sp. P94(2023)]MBQ4839643.1 TIGR02285 family protein [Pseudoalteromonas luteoviolacea]MDK2593751.1 TIGR02285 family protein [Pseudoalteromonas sp. P94(2023)]